MSERSFSNLQRLATAPTAVGLATRLALSHLERQGLDPVPLLKRSGLSRISLARGARVSAVSQIGFLEEVARATGDNWIGLTLAADFDLRETGMLYYVAASSHQLGEALARLERYVRLGNESVIAQLDKGVPGRIRVSYLGVPRHRDRHFMEFLALVVVRLSRHLVGQDVAPAAVGFVHHRTGDQRRVQRILGCDVEFGASSDEIRFNAASMELTLLGDDPFLNRLMVNMCEEAIATRSPNISPFRTTLENVIAPLLPHARANAKAVAATIGLSERTFARRMAAEGLSFGGILDDLRRDLAMRYLREDFQVSQIAWLLGFQQPSSFTHACRRWTGKSPSALRRNRDPAS